MIRTTRNKKRSRGRPRGTGKPSALATSTYSVIAGLLRGDTVGELAARFQLSRQRVAFIGAQVRRAGIRFPCPQAAS